jgi:hypothetical protein
MFLASQLFLSHCSVWLNKSTALKLNINMSLCMYQLNIYTVHISV